MPEPMGGDMATGGGGSSKERKARTKPPQPEAYDPVTGTGRWLYDQVIGAGSYGTVWRVKDMIKDAVVDENGRRPHYALKVSNYNSGSAPTYQLHKEYIYSELIHAKGPHKNFVRVLEDHTRWRGTKPIDAAKYECPNYKWEVKPEPIIDARGNALPEAIKKSGKVDYIVMEFVYGKRFRMRKLGRGFTLRQIRQIVLECAQGLQHLQSLTDPLQRDPSGKIVHRDFRMANLIWVPGEQSGGYNHATSAASSSSISSLAVASSASSSSASAMARLHTGSGNNFCSHHDAGRVVIIDYGLMTYACPENEASKNPIVYMHARDGNYWIPPECIQRDSSTSGTIARNFQKPYGSLDVYSLGILIAELVYPLRLGPNRRMDAHESDHSLEQRRRYQDKMYERVRDSDPSMMQCLGKVAKSFGFSEDLLTRLTHKQSTRRPSIDEVVRYLERGEAKRLEKDAGGKRRQHGQHQTAGTLASSKELMSDRCDRLFSEVILTEKIMARFDRVRSNERICYDGEAYRAGFLQCFLELKDFFERKRQHNAGRERDPRSQPSGEPGSAPPLLEEPVLPGTDLTKKEQDLVEQLSRRCACFLVDIRGEQFERESVIDFWLLGPEHQSMPRARASLTGEQSFIKHKQSHDRWMEKCRRLAEKFDEPRAKLWVCVAILAEFDTRFPSSSKDNRATGRGFVGRDLDEKGKQFLSAEVSDAIREVIRGGRETERTAIYQLWNCAPLDGRQTGNGDPEESLQQIYHDVNSKYDAGTCDLQDHAKLTQAHTRARAASEKLLNDALNLKRRVFVMASRNDFRLKFDAIRDHDYVTKYVTKVRRSKVEVPVVEKGEGVATEDNARTKNTASRVEAPGGVIVGQGPARSSSSSCSCSPSGSPSSPNSRSRNAHNSHRSRDDMSEVHKKLVELDSDSQLLAQKIGDCCTKIEKHSRMALEETRARTALAEMKQLRASVGEFRKKELVRYLREERGKVSQNMEAKMKQLREAVEWFIGEDAGYVLSPVQALDGLDAEAGGEEDLRMDSKGKGNRSGDEQKLPRSLEMLRAQLADIAKNFGDEVDLSDSREIEVQLECGGRGGGAINVPSTTPAANSVSGATSGTASSQTPPSTKMVVGADPSELWRRFVKHFRGSSQPKNGRSNRNQRPLPPLDEEAWPWFCTGKARLREINSLVKELSDGMIDASGSHVLLRWEQSGVEKLRRQPTNVSPTDAEHRAKSLAELHCDFLEIFKDYLRKLVEKANGLIARSNDQQTVATAGRRGRAAAAVSPSASGSAVSGGGVITARSEGRVPFWHFVQLFERHLCMLDIFDWMYEDLHDPRNATLAQTPRFQISRSDLHRDFQANRELLREFVVSDLKSKIENWGLKLNPATSSRRSPQAANLAEMQLKIGLDIAIALEYSRCAPAACSGEGSGLSLVPAKTIQELAEGYRRARSDKLLQPLQQRWQRALDDAIRIGEEPDVTKGCDAKAVRAKVGALHDALALSQVMLRVYCDPGARAEGGRGPTVLFVRPVHSTMRSGTTRFDWCSGQDADEELGQRLQHFFGAFRKVFATHRSLCGRFREHLRILFPRLVDAVGAEKEKLEGEFYNVASELQILQYRHGQVAPRMEQAGRASLDFLKNCKTLRTDTEKSNHSEALAHYQRTLPWLVRLRQKQSPGKFVGTCQRSAVSQNIQPGADTHTASARLDAGILGGGSLFSDDENEQMAEHVAPGSMEASPEQAADEEHSMSSSSSLRKYFDDDWLVAGETSPARLQRLVRITAPPEEQTAPPIEQPVAPRAASLRHAPARARSASAQAGDDKTRQSASGVSASNGSSVADYCTAKEDASSRSRAYSAADVTRSKSQSAAKGDESSKTSTSNMFLPRNDSRAAAAANGAKAEKSTENSHGSNDVEQERTGQSPEASELSSKGTIRSSANEADGPHEEKDAALPVRAVPAPPSLPAPPLPPGASQVTPRFAIAPSDRQIENERRAAIPQKQLVPAKTSSSRGASAQQATSSKIASGPRLSAAPNAAPLGVFEQELLRAASLSQTGNGAPVVKTPVVGQGLSSSSSAAGLSCASASARAAWRQQMSKANSPIVRLSEEELTQKFREMEKLPPLAKGLVDFILDNHEEKKNARGAEQKLDGTAAEDACERYFTLATEFYKGYCRFCQTVVSPKKEQGKEPTQRQILMRLYHRADQTPRFEVWSRLLLQLVQEAAKVLLDLVGIPFAAKGAAQRIKDMIDERDGNKMNKKGKPNKKTKAKPCDYYEMRACRNFIVYACGPAGKTEFVSTWRERFDQQACSFFVNGLKAAVDKDTRDAKQSKRNRHDIFVCLRQLNGDGFKGIQIRYFSEQQEQALNEKCAGDPGSEDEDCGLWWECASNVCRRMCQVDEVTSGKVSAALQGRDRTSTMSSPQLTPRGSLSAAAQAQIMRQQAQSAQQYSYNRQPYAAAASLSGPGDMQRLSHSLHQHQLAQSSGGVGARMELSLDNYAAKSGAIGRMSKPVERPAQPRFSEVALAQAAAQQSRKRTAAAAATFSEDEQEQVDEDEESDSDSDYDERKSKRARGKHARKKQKLKSEKARQHQKASATLLSNNGSKQEQDHRKPLQVLAHAPADTKRTKTPREASKSSARGGDGALSARSLSKSNAAFKKEEAAEFRELLRAGGHEGGKNNAAHIQPQFGAGSHFANYLPAQQGYASAQSVRLPGGPAAAPKAVSQCSKMDDDVAAQRVLTNHASSPPPLSSNLGSAIKLDDSPLLAAQPPQSQSISVVDKENADPVAALDQRRRPPTPSKPALAPPNQCHKRAAPNADIERPLLQNKRRKRSVEEVTSTSAAHFVEDGQRQRDGGEQAVLLLDTGIIDEDDDLGDVPAVEVQLPPAAPAARAAVRPAAASSATGRPTGVPASSTGAAAQPVRRTAFQRNDRAFTHLFKNPPRG